MEVQNNINKKLGIVCCYFNPCNYLSKFLNYIEFINELRDFDVHILAVESYNEDSVYRINKIFDNTLCVYSDQVYWQKEGLINIGIGDLITKGYDYVAWIDADVKFLTKTWVDDLVHKLSKYKVVQPYAHTYKESSGKKYIYSKSIASVLKNNSIEDNITQLMGRQGELGHACAYHANIFSEELLYDKCIVGAGDFLNLVGVMHCNYLEKHIPQDRFFKGCSESYIADFLNWSRQIQSVDSIGYCDSNLYVKYHGESRNRFYIEREDILKKHKFCPKTDIQLDKDTNTGLYKLLNTELATDIKKYFISRREDEHIQGSETKKKLIKEVHELLSWSHDTPLQKKKLLGISKLCMSPAPKTLGDFNVFNLEQYNPDIMVIASKINEDYFSLNRIKYKDKLVIDKSSHNQTGSVISTTPGGHNETYLNFIVKFYHRLPEQCIFINEKIKSKKYVNLINTLYNKTSTNTGFVPLEPENKKKLIISKKHEGSFNIWWSSHMNGLKFEKNMYYYKDENFCVDKKTILKHPIIYYKKLLKSARNIKNPNEENYIERSWRYIFK